MHVRHISYAVITTCLVGVISAACGCSKDSSGGPTSDARQPPADAPHLSNDSSVRAFTDLCTLDGSYPDVDKGVCKPTTEPVAEVGLASFFAPSQGKPLFKNCDGLPNYDSVLTSAQGIKFRIEDQTLFFRDERYVGLETTGIHVTALNLGEPCSAFLLFTLPQKRVKLPVGSSITFTSRIYVRDPEKDVNRTIVLRDEGGHLVALSLGGVRAEVWDAELLPELRVSAGQLVCPASPPKTPESLFIRFELSDGTARCGLDSSTARCCSLLSRTFEVFSPHAYKSDHVEITVVGVDREYLQGISLDEWNASAPSK